MFLITIDGPAGSGKTSLAALIQYNLESVGEQVATIHMDDLYSGWESALSDNLRVTLEKILKEAEERAEIEVPHFDWQSEQFSQPIVIPTPTVLILEGVGSGQSATRSRANVKLWVEAPAEVALSRVLERDGEGIRGQMVKWQEQELVHFHSEESESAADYRVKSAP